MAFWLGLLSTKNSINPECFFQLSILLNLMLTLYSINVQGKRQFVYSMTSSLNMCQTLSYSFLYFINWVQLSQMSMFSMVDILHGGWHPALFMMLFSTQWEKLYCGFGSHGLCGLFSFSFLMTLCHGLLYYFEAFKNYFEHFYL